MDGHLSAEIPALYAAENAQQNLWFKTGPISRCLRQALPLEPAGFLTTGGMSVFAGMRCSCSICGSGTPSGNASAADESLALLMSASLQLTHP